MLPEQLAASCLGEEFLAQDHGEGHTEFVGLKMVKLDVALSWGLYNKIIRNVFFFVFFTEF